MNTPRMKSLVQTAVGFVGATLMGSWLLAQPVGDKSPRGEPIKPAGVRGEPIRSAVAVTAAATSDPVRTAKSPGYLPLEFKELAGFTYVVPEYAGTNAPPPPDTNQIPASVRGFNGRKVALRGFMLPLKVESGKVTELLLMRDQSVCCFGAIPRLNEFVTVKMTGGGTRAVMDQAVTLLGKLKVGEFSENGYLLGIYQIDGDRVEESGLQ